MTHEYIQVQLQIHTEQQRTWRVRGRGSTRQKHGRDRAAGSSTMLCGAELLLVSYCNAIRQDMLQITCSRGNLTELSAVAILAGAAVEHTVGVVSADPAMLTDGGVRALEVVRADRGDTVIIGGDCFA